MFKKMTLLAAALAAFVAFAVPAAAQAEDAVVTNSLGEPASAITAHSTNVVSHTSGGTLECTTVDLSVTLTENTNGTATGHGTGTGIGNPTAAGGPTHTGNCIASSGLGVQITHVGVSSIDLKKGGTGTASFSYTYDLIHPTMGKIAECTFSGHADLAVSGGNVITLVNGTLASTSGAPCPASGSIVGDLEVTDEFGQAAIIH